MPSAPSRSHKGVRPLLRILRSRLSRLRSIIGLVSLVIAFLATGLYLINHYGFLGERIARLVSRHAHLIHILDGVQGAHQEINGAFILRLAGDETGAIGRYEENIEVLAGFRKDLMGLMVHLPDDLHEPAQEVVGRLEHFEENARLFFDIDGTDTFEQAFLERYAAHMSPFMVDLSESVREMQKLNYEIFAEGGDATRASVVKGIRLLMLLMLIALLAFLYGVYLYACRIFRPMQRLSQAVRQLAVNDMEVALPEFSTRELGTFSRPMNMMVRKVEQARRQDRLKLERVRRTLEASVASLIHPLFVLDNRDQIVLSNPAGSNFLRIIDTGSADISPLPPQLKDAVNKVRLGGPSFNPKNLVDALVFSISGTERFFVPRIARLSDTQGEFFGCSLLLEDVTDLRLIDDLRATFIGMIGHELQSPMTVVRMGLHLLRKTAYPTLSEADRETLTCILEDAERLQKMLQNLLDLNRIDGQGIGLNVMEWIAAEELPKVLERFCRLHRKNTDFCRIEIEPGLPTLRLDHDRIDHVFLNLLSNAKDYAKKGAPVILRAAVLSDNWVRFSVVDKGPGIEPEQLESLFVPFYRVPGQARPGAGLGLSIAERIVRMHGGRIHAESEVGVGTSLQVDVPSAKPPALNPAKCR